MFKIKTLVLLQIELEMQDYLECRNFTGFAQEFQKNKFNFIGAEQKKISYFKQEQKKVNWKITMTIVLNHNLNNIR